MGKPSKKGPSLHVILDSHGNKLETFTLQSVRRSPAASPAGRRHSNTMPPKVYIVDPRGFRHLVQKLTGSPRGDATAGGDKRGGFRRVVPPALRLPRSEKAITSSSELDVNLSPEGCDERTLPLLPAITSSSELDVNLSPEEFEVGPFDFLASPLAVQSPWFSFPLLSPGTMASLEEDGSV